MNHPAPTVIPLVWEEPCTSNNHTYVARSCFGDFYIHICGGRHSAWLEAHTKPYERYIGETVGTVLEAQSLADEYYQVAVLAFLESSE